MRGEGGEVYDFSSKKVTIKSKTTFTGVWTGGGPNRPPTAAWRHRGEISRNCTLFELTRQSKSDTFLRANLSGQRTITGCLCVGELTLLDTRQIIRLTLRCIQHLSKPFQPAGLTSELYKGLEMQSNAKKGTLL